MFNQSIDPACINRILVSARSHSGWFSDPVTEQDLRAIYEIAKWSDDRELAAAEDRLLHQP